MAPTPTAKEMETVEEALAKEKAITAECKEVS